MEPTKYNFTLYQGATWVRQLTLKDDDGTVVNLTGYHAKMQLRGSRNELVPLLLEISEINGIVLAATSPNIILTISAAKTAELQICKAVYDLILTAPNGDVNPLLTGDVMITFSVTK